MVLVDDKGNERGCSLNEHTNIFGEWHVLHNGITYIVEVKREADKKESADFDNNLRPNLEKKQFRITFMSEIYIEADSAEEAKQKFSEIPLFTGEAYEHAAEFVEYISINEQKEN